MDENALKIILELKDENTLMKRGIKDAIVMLVKRKKHTIVEYDEELGELKMLLGVVYDIVADLNGEERPNRSTPKEITIVLE